jgi:hypothetical protein
MERILEELTRLLAGWLRQHIRQMYRKRWKKVQPRYENLIRLGIPKDHAWPLGKHPERLLADNQ